LPDTGFDEVATLFAWRMTGCQSLSSTGNFSKVQGHVEPLRNVSRTPSRAPSRSQEFVPKHGKRLLLTALDGEEMFVTDFDVWRRHGSLKKPGRSDDERRERRCRVHRPLFNAPGRDVLAWRATSVITNSL